MVVGGHKIVTTIVLTYLCVISIYTAIISLNVSVLNSLKILAYDIQNDYIK